MEEFHVDPGEPRDFLARLRREESFRDYPVRLRAQDGLIKDVLMNADAGSGGDVEKLAAQLRDAGVPAVVEGVEPDRLAARIRERLDQLRPGPRRIYVGWAQQYRCCSLHCRHSSWASLVPLRPLRSLRPFFYSVAALPRYVLRGARTI